MTNPTALALLLEKNINRSPWRAYRLAELVPYWGSISAFWPAMKILMEESKVLALGSSETMSDLSRFVPNNDELLDLLESSMDCYENRQPAPNADLMADVLAAWHRSDRLKSDRRTRMHRRCRWYLRSRIKGGVR